VHSHVLGATQAPLFLQDGVQIAARYEFESKKVVPQTIVAIVASPAASKSDYWLSIETHDNKPNLAATLVGSKASSVNT
jgi:hypothetical protein